MLGNLFKIFKKSKEEEKKKDAAISEKIADSLKEKSEDFSKFLSEKIDFIQDEFKIITKKTKNLRTTNHLLGLKHLENGKLPEAIFRFRFMTKIWPDYEDAQFLLAYCLTLNKKPKEAKKILEKLLAKNPNYDHKAKDLLDNINSSQ